MLNIFCILLVKQQRKAFNSYSVFLYSSALHGDKGDDLDKVCTQSCWHVLFSFAFIALILFSFCLFHQKLDGCNKMTCTGCMQYFCWICMGSLSRANPYKHFTDPASPCFNRYVYTIPCSQQQFLVLHL